MDRERYVDSYVTGVLASLQDRLHPSIQPPVDVYVRLSSVEKILQNMLKETMNKSLNNLEERFRVYASRCIAMEETPDDQVKKMKRSISRLESHVRKNFTEGEKDTFERKLARNHQHREALKSCFQDLIKDLNLQGSDLIDVLFQNGVMSQSDLDSIRSLKPSRKMNEEFLHIVCGKLTLGDFNNVFLPTLNKDYPFLCDRLVEEMDKLQEQEHDSTLCIACRVRNDVQVKRLAAPLYKSKAVTLTLHADLTGDGLSNRAKWAELVRNRVSPEAIIESLKLKYPDFYREFKANQKGTLECFCSDREFSEDVLDGLLLAPDALGSAPSDDCFSYSSTIDDKEGISEIPDFEVTDSVKEYDMKPASCGVCLIINNTTFRSSRLRQRDGSEKDGNRLKETFEKLGFFVDIKNDQTAAEIMTLVKEYSKDIDHSASDAFVCCLLSHGTEDLFYGADGMPLRVSDITSEFTAYNCPSLAGKPKLFFIQADRGKHKMKGYTIPPRGATTASADGFCEPQDVIAEEADFLIGYCTPPGYASFRSRSNGSWYIKTLCDVLDTHAENNDILSCLLMVNDQIARAQARPKGGETRMEKQVPAPVFTLRKKLYLTVDPGYHPSPPGQDQASASGSGPV